jgi:hypothetical protein
VLTISKYYCLILLPGQKMILSINISVKKPILFLLTALSIDFIIAMEHQTHTVVVTNRLTNTIVVSKPTEVTMKEHKIICDIFTKITPLRQCTFSLKPKRSISTLRIILSDKYKQSSYPITIDKPKEAITIHSYSPAENSIIISNTTNELARIHAKNHKKY